MDGLRGVEVTPAMVQSARSGRTVRIGPVAVQVRASLNPTGLALAGGR